jgi:hypothetical protein
MPEVPPQDDSEHYQQRSPKLRGNIVNSDALLIGVMAEVAYRTEELQKAGRSVWVDRARRVHRRARAARSEVEVPAQERREVRRVAAGAGEITR